MIDVLVITRLTLREAIRRRLAWALLFLTALVVVATALILFGLAWIMGVLARFATLFGIQSLQQVAAVTDRLLPSDVFWAGATASLEPTSAQLVQAGFAGSIAAGRFGPFFVPGPPGVLELAWSVAWIGLVLGMAVLAFERREL